MIRALFWIGVGVVVEQFRSARPSRPLPACVCGHPASAHEHYRAGRDCGACGRFGPDACTEYEAGRRPSSLITVPDVDADGLTPVDLLRLVRAEQAARHDARVDAALLRPPAV